MKRFAGHSDDELVAMYSGGCNEAFDALLQRYDGYLHGYLRKAISDDDLVEDIFQDSFIKVMTILRSGGYEESGRFRHWLTRITHNLLMDHFRREKIRAKVHSSYDEDDSDQVFRGISIDEPNAEDVLIQSDSLVELYLHVNGLPQDQRDVVLMRYWEDMSFKEIASRTGVSINTALGRMRYALKNLRKHIGQ